MAPGPFFSVKVFARFVRVAGQVRRFLSSSVLLACFLSASVFTREFWPDLDSKLERYLLATLGAILYIKTELLNGQRMLYHVKI